MIKTRILLILNPIIAILILNQAVTGILKKSISYGTYEVLHGVGGIITVIAVIIHVILNWKWVSSNYFKRKV